MDKAQTVLAFLQRKIMEDEIDLFDALAISAGLYTLVKLNAIQRGNMKGMTKLECEDHVKKSFEDLVGDCQNWVVKTVEMKR